MAMIASGLGGCAGYYRGAYPNGAVYLLLVGPELAALVELPVLRFGTVLPELISSFDIHNHALAVRGLARGLGLSLDEQASRIVVSDGCSHATVEFDARGFINSLESEIRK